METYKHIFDDKPALQLKLENVLIIVNSINKQWDYIKTLLNSVKEEGEDFSTAVLESAEAFMLSRVTLRHKLTALRMLSDVAYLEKRMHINARAERYDKAIEFRNKIEEAKQWNLKC